MDATSRPGAGRLEAHGPDPAAFTRGLLDDVLRFQDGDPRDDVAVLGVRALHPGSLPPGSGRG